LRVPALRDRQEDIPDFIDFFTAKFAEKYNRPRWVPDPETLKQFCEFAWPGNIRQLSQVIEQSYVLDGSPVLPNKSGLQGTSRGLPFTDLNRLRYVAVHQALKATHGHKGRAASLLGVHANTLTRILAQMSRDGELPAIEE
jgi:DNA-binding NtrC family response regulator